MKAGEFPKTLVINDTRNKVIEIWRIYSDREQYLVYSVQYERYSEL